MTQLPLKNGLFDLNYPRIMGILNVTPDSFSDGGHFVAVNQSVEHALAMIEQGADIIDIGGESTRPGAAKVTVEDELERVVPVIEAIRKHTNVPISIDTSKALVMRAAVNAGADMINDVRALMAENALATAADLGVPVCLMHMQGLPDTMQLNPQYSDVINDVGGFLRQRIEFAVAAGIDKRKILIDPGFGFGKTLRDNYVLLNQLESLHSLGCPLLVGMSRKSMIGKLLNNEVDERLAGSISCAILAAQKGAQIIRVHDVQATKDALMVMQATANPNGIETI